MYFFRNQILKESKQPLMMATHFYQLVAHYKLSFNQSWQNSVGWKYVWHQISFLW